ncbi:MAG: HAMP domain-containing histidine kinase, partial [Rhizobacter sp.]|nr:HAMP domain-containing histidine kinase [Chlorobiales bacterium]
FFLAEFSPLLMDRESIVGFKVLMKDITPEKQNQIEQEVIITISEAMNRSDVINDITQEISYKLKSLFDPSLMNIYRYEPPENMLVACRTLGSESSVSEVTQRYFVDQSSEGVAPQTAVHRKEYFIEDCRRSLLLQYAAAYIQSRNGRSLFSVPMIASGELQGVLQVLTTGSKMLSQDERELIRVVADEIASGFYRKRLTAAIAKANDELGAKNDELENFVSSVSHDLKAPLISIQGYATQIGEQLYESLSQDARFCLERIRYNAKNMEELISDLLDLSRVGRETPVMDDIFIYEMLSGIRENYLQQISGRNITIDIPTELPHVKYPRRRLEQVLTNLFGNAIRYTARVPEPHIKVYATEDEHFYEIVVKDNGIGIDKKSHEKVFRMFERLDISDKSGTGVGLAIVKKVVEQYGGKVWIVSEAGQGAAFHFTIRKQQ